MSRSSGSREEGAIAVIVAISAVILLVMAAFAVDIGKTWAKRGELQVQADQAAVAAANGLPVVPTDAASQRSVARHALHYLACNKVGGQQFNLPACTSSLTPDSTSLNAAADVLIANGAVNKAPGIRFPSTTSVEVITPAADIDFTFGQSAGVSGTTAVKRATAQVSSPGQMLPVALTKICAISSGQADDFGPGIIRGEGDLNTAYATGASPMRAIALGVRDDDPPLAWKSSPALPAFEYPAAYGATVQNNLRMEVYAPTWNLGPKTWELAANSLAGFSVGNEAATPWGAAVLHDNVQFWRRNDEGTGWHLQATATFGSTITGGAGTIPQAVLQRAGSYWVTVSTKWVVGSKVRWIPAGQAEQINIVSKEFPADAETRFDHSPIGIPSGGCARYLDSPRVDTGNGVVDGTSATNSTLVKNILGGVDHRYGLDRTASASCGGTGSVRDATVHTDGNAADPNCLMLTSKNARSLEITRAWLGDPSGGIRGRLDCGFQRFNARSNCEHSTFSLWGRTFNNDDLTDYFTTSMQQPTSYRKFGMAQASYDGQGLPLTSPPPSKLSSEVYYSPRLFWAPVISTPDSNVPQGTLQGREFPVYTYRPVWLVHQAPGDIVPGWKQEAINEAWCTSDPAPTSQWDHEYSEYRSGLDRGHNDGDYTGVILNGLTRGGADNSKLAAICQLINSPDPRNVPSFEDDNRRIKALRFQTIEPVSMPEPPIDYSGPLTDYVGTGPRVVRLVR